MESHFFLYVFTFKVEVPLSFMLHIHDVSQLVLEHLMFFLLFWNKVLKCISFFTSFSDEELMIDCSKLCR